MLIKLFFTLPNSGDAEESFVFAHVILLGRWTNISTLTFFESAFFLQQDIPVNKRNQSLSICKNREKHQLTNQQFGIILGKHQIPAKESVS